MPPRWRPRDSVLLPSLFSVGLVSLLVGPSVSLGLTWSPPGSSVPFAGTTAASAGDGLISAVIPCSAFSPTFVQVDVISPPLNLTGGYLYYEAPAPLNASFNVTILGPASNYTYDLSWGDGSPDLTGTWNTTTNPSAAMPLQHRYVLPGWYFPVFQATYVCDGGGGSVGDGASIEAYGPAGAWPVTVSATPMNQTVPAQVNFTAVVAGAPANATLSWYVSLPNGSSIKESQTSANLTNSSLSINVTTPGDLWGTVYVYYGYPSSLPYAFARLPDVTITPLVAVAVTHTFPTGPPPWNISYWANVTNLSGGPAPSNATPHWTFEGMGGVAYSIGPTVGVRVWREYWANFTGTAQELATATVSRADGVVMGWQSKTVDFTMPPTSLALRATPSSGVAPFSFDVSTQLLNPDSAINVTQPYSLRIVVTDSNGSPVWNRSVSDWDGSPLVVPGVLPNSGTYVVTANASITFSGSSGPLAGARTTIVVLAPVVPSLAAPAGSRDSADVGQSVVFSSAFTGPPGLGRFAWTGLPTGCVSVNASAVTCVPSTPGTASVSAHLTYATGRTVDSPATQFSVFTDPTVSAPTPSVPSATAGQNVTFSITSTPGSGGDAFGWHGLPPACAALAGPFTTTVGCSMAAGNYSIWASVQDSNGVVSNGSSLLFRVAAAPPNGGPPGAGGSPWPSLAPWSVGAAIAVAVGLATGAFALHRRRRSGRDQPTQRDKNRERPR